MTDFSEKAITQVVSEATKALFEAVRIRMTAAARRASARDEAVAEDIKDAAKRLRKQKNRQDQRAEELRDVKHQKRLIEARQRVGLPLDKRNKAAQLFTTQMNEIAEEASAIAVRTENKSLSPMRERQRMLGIQRTMEEIEIGQETIEKLIVGAALRLQEDPESESPRKLSDDWLRQFFKYASEVSDAQLLNVLERALADAAQMSRPLTSPRTIDTLRFFQPHTYEMFNRASKPLLIFGAVPSAYFDRDKRAKDIDLPLLMEMGLIKVDRVRAFTFSIGLYRFTFAYKPGERQEHELLKLTQVGKEITGLRDANARTLHRYAIGEIVGEEVWRLQRHFGIAEEEVTFLARSLVMDMCDKAGLRIEVYRSHDGANQSVLEQHRDRVEEPFGLKFVSSTEDCDEQNRHLLSRVRSEFDDFDSHQLEAIIEHSAKGMRNA